MISFSALATILDKSYRDKGRLHVKITPLTLQKGINILISPPPLFNVDLGGGDWHSNREL